MGRQRVRACARYGTSSRANEHAEPGCPCDFSGYPRVLVTLSDFVMAAVCLGIEFLRYAGLGDLEEPVQEPIGDAFKDW